VSAKQAFFGKKAVQLRPIREVFRKKSVAISSDIVL
jgi:hypothetical protein